MPSTKSLAVKTAIVRAHLAGVSKNRIARELKVAKPTVLKVLKESEIDSTLQASYSRVIENAIEMADSVVAKAKKDGEFALTILERIGVIAPGQNGNSSGSNVQINFSATQTPFANSAKSAEKPATSTDCVIDVPAQTPAQKQE